jgi:hypothetical protein
MKRIIGIIFLITLLAGCAALEANRAAQSVDRYEALQPILCSEKAECDLFWSRIQAWIAQNSSYRLQSTTPVLIATYGPSMKPDSTYVAYKAIREDNRDGSASIKITASCLNIFTCERNPDKAIADLKNYVTAK